MANNKIKLFGTNLQKYNGSTAPDDYDAARGLFFEDDTWDNAEVGNSSIRKSGFVPNTPVSSIALNTALRQASVGSKIIGDIITSDILGIQSEEDVQTEDLSNVATYTNNLITYLSKINGLINGTVVAKVASNYDESSTNPDSINMQLSTLADNVNTQISDIKNGTTLVGRAKYYAGGGNRTISEKFTELYDKMNNLGIIVDETPFTLQPDFVQDSNRWIVRQANMVWGELYVNYNGGMFQNSKTIAQITDTRLRSPTTKTVPGRVYVYVSGGVPMWAGATFEIQADGYIQCTIPNTFYREQSNGYWFDATRFEVCFAYITSPRT